MTVREVTVRDLCLADIGREVEVRGSVSIVKGILWSISYEQDWNDVTAIRDRTSRREPVATSAALEVSGWSCPDLPLDTEIYVWDN